MDSMESNATIVSSNTFGSGSASTTFLSIVQRYVAPVFVVNALVGNALILLLSLTPNAFSRQNSLTVSAYYVAFAVADLVSVIFFNFFQWLGVLCYPYGLCAVLKSYSQKITLSHSFMPNKTLRMRINWVIYCTVWYFISSPVRCTLLLHISAHVHKNVITPMYSIKCCRRSHVQHRDSICERCGLQRSSVPVLFGRDHFSSAARPVHSEPCDSDRMAVCCENYTLQSLHSHWDRSDSKCLQTLISESVLSNPRFYWFNNAIMLISAHSTKYFNWFF